jgi:hypothetical protein
MNNSGIFRIGRLMALLAAVGLALCAFPLRAQDQSAIWNRIDPTSVDIQAESVPLNFQDAKRTHIGRLTYMGGLELKSTDPRFGGLSGLRVSPDGRYMLALSDNGIWVAANLSYSGGRLSGIRNGVIAPLLDAGGQFVARHGKEHGDSEAFTEIPGGGIVVSFEGDNRLWYYGTSINDALNKKLPRPLPLPIDLYQDISTQPANGGIEALTTLADGSLLAFSEEAKDENGNHKGWFIGADGKIERLAYKPHDGLSPSDMATLPNGDVLVLERRLSVLGGWTARLRQIKESDLHSGKPLVGEEVAELQFPFNLDNMEGLAVRQDGAGHTYIYLVSDDNYSNLQRTILLMFRLDKKPLEDDQDEASSSQCRMCRMVIDAMSISSGESAKPTGRNQGPDPRP